MYCMRASNNERDEVSGVEQGSKQCDRIGQMPNSFLISSTCGCGYKR